MINIAICDDSKELVERLEKQLKQISKEIDEEIQVQKFYSGESFLSSRHCQIDIVFLDIHMPGGMNGIETGVRLRKKNEHITIIYLTSIVQYATEGYKVSAASYIIKPITLKRMKTEVLNWIKKHQNLDDPFILVRNRNGEYKIRLKSLIYIETFKRTLLFHTENEEIPSLRKMKDVESELADQGFARCHVGYLVNLLYVDTVEKLEVKLITGQSIPIAKLKKNDFMVCLTDFWGKRI